MDFSIQVGSSELSPAPPLLATPFITAATGVDNGQRFPFSFPSHNVSASSPDTSVNWDNFLPLPPIPSLITTTAWHTSTTTCFRFNGKSQETPYCLVASSPMVPLRSTRSPVRIFSTGKNCHFPSCARYFLRFTFTDMLTIHLLSTNRNGQFETLPGYCGRL